MPNDTISKSNSSSSSSNSMPPPKKKQRKESHDTSTPVKIAAAPPVSLPPPIMPYHPHLVPSYYPVYPQHPYFLAVQPPVSPSLSPTLSCTNSPTSKATTATTINNNKSTNVVTAQSPSALTPSYPIYPYPVQLSPQLHPNNPSAPLNPRHNSISSTGTTADEREQARKVSHSAIERRRRERINDKIMQLKDLIPSCAERDNLHKMTILQSAIDYIGYLKGLVNELDDKQSSTGSNQLPEFQINMQQQSKSMLPKEAEKFTSQFSIERRVTESSKTKKKRQNENDDEEEEDDDDEDDDDVVLIEDDQQQQQQQQQQNQNQNQKQRQEDEDGWSNCSSPLSLVANEKKMPVPVTSLKPMDVMGLSSHTSTPPPKIVVDVQDSHAPPITDRNMNLENILC